jgi:hypothetical protein
MILKISVEKSVGDFSNAYLSACCEVGEGLIIGYLIDAVKDRFIPSCLLHDSVPKARGTKVHFSSGH